MTALRFVATTQHITIAAGTYLRVVPASVAARKRPYEIPEDERPLIPAFEPCLPPDMETGSGLDLNGKPAVVVWADRSRAIIEVAGRAWLMSHMTPWEMSLHRNSFERGSYVQEWIIREEVDLSRSGSA
jgi:hypothetical protein